MSVRKAFVWAISGQLLSFFATLGTTVILTRLLNPHEIGIYAVSMAIVGILQAVSAFGISAYLVSEQDLTDEKLHSAFTVNAIASVMLCVVIAASSLVSEVIKDDPLIGTTLRILSVIPALAIVEFIPSVMLQRDMRFGLFSQITIARTFLGSVTSIAGALLGAGALSPAYGALAFAVVGSILFPLAAQSQRRARVSLTQWRVIVSFGIKSLSIGGVSLISMRLSEIILGRMLGLSSLGIYTRANSISVIIFQNLYGSAARVFMAQMADEESRGNDLRSVYLRGLDIVLGLMWPVVMGIAVLSGPVVLLLFGPLWIAASLPLSILMIVQAIGLSFAMSSELFILRNEIGRQVPLESFRSLIGVCAFTVGCFFGIAGAAAGRIFDSITGAYLFIPHMRRLSNAKPGELAGIFHRNMVLTAVAITPSCLLMAWHGWNASVPLGQVGASIVAAAVLWLAALRHQRHPLYDEALLVLRRSGIYPRRYN